jgi:hypothetical protein
MVPMDKAEHAVMVGCLVSAGSLHSEAESIIASQKTTFNKACQKHKKSEINQDKGSTKKPSKSSKNLTKKSLDHGF